MSVISASQNAKNRGQRRFCDDGSRSAAERKRGQGPQERERSDRAVDGGSRYIQRERSTANAAARRENKPRKQLGE